MTPAARLSAAIAILDRILGGTPAEQALVNWARASRFAGSGDRNAIRDLVFDALRCRRSHAVLGGGETGRGLILGGLRAAGVDPAPLFTGEGHAPAPIGPEDAGAAPTGAAALDLPDWIFPQLQQDLGDDLAPIAAAMRHRAPVFLRVNRARSTREAVQAELAAEGVETRPHPLAETALEVMTNPRKVQTLAAFTEGRVELQDAASQAVVEALPLTEGMRVLDYCAGGGGKTLAMAGRAKLRLFAHDADPRRMRDLPARATRAGVRVTLSQSADLDRQAPFDLVLTDVPCSGSGSWRRAPEGKWLITPEKLENLLKIQSDILDRAAGLVRAGGWLGYATCSLLTAENRGQIDAFLARQPGWSLHQDRRLTPLDGGDGFYVAVLQKNT